MKFQDSSRSLYINIADNKKITLIINEEKDQFEEETHTYKSSRDEDWHKETLRGQESSICLQPSKTFNNQTLERS
jgi:hypothetical protein